MRLTNAAHFNPIQFFYRGGAAGARGAHNSEDIGSKPISGIVKLDAINAAHFKPLPRRTFYRLTSTLLTSKPRWSDSRMVIFFLIKRTMWDRYLQVVIVKLDAINAATPNRHDLSRIVSFYRHGAEAARGAHNSEVTGSKPVAGILPKSYKHVLFILFNKQTHTMADVRDTRIEQMKTIQAEALELFRRKNADYGDAFAKYGVIGVLMRIEDKLQRSMSITKNGVNLVADEGIRDTLIDLHNYAAMALMLMDE